MRSRKHQLLLLWCHFQTVSSPKKAQRNYIDVIHPSIHSSLGGQGSNKKTSTNTTPPILAGFSWKKQKTGYHFFFTKDRCQVQYMVLCLLTGTSCFSFFFGIQLVALRASKKLHDSFMEGEGLNKKAGGTIGNGGKI